MLKEVFLGRFPSQFQVNQTVKYFILSETLVWSAWNFIAPIFAIFAANHITGGNVSIAASAVSCYLIVRVIFELSSGQYLSKSSENKRLQAAILGTIIVSFAFLGFAFTTTVLPIYIFYGLAGIGMGVATPAKNSLFSTHLDKNRETSEWGIYDATVFIGMALAAALGGFIANYYGFKLLFILAAALNLIGILPYFLLFSQQKATHSLFTFFKS